MHISQPEEASIYLDMFGAKVPKLLHDASHKIYKKQYEKALEEFNRSSELAQEFIYLF